MAGRRVIFVAGAGAVIALGLAVSSSAHHAKPKCFGQAATIMGNGHVTGTNGNDVIITGSGNDFIEAKAGADRVCTRGGNDVVTGEDGADRINTGAGDDEVGAGGDEANDVVKTRRGNDGVDA